MSSTYPTITKRLRAKEGGRRISKSNLITGLLAGGFVTLVVLGLVLAYVIVPANQRGVTTGSGSLYVSAITMISGSSSTSSLSSACSGDAQLEVYVTNTLPGTIYLTNITIGKPQSAANATTLIPSGSSCIPVAENTPAIASGSNDLLIITYPNIPIPPYQNWNVTLFFSNGQKLAQPSLISEPT